MTTRSRVEQPATQLAASAAGDDSSLQRSVTRGVKWKGATLVVGEGSRVLVGLVLARLLAPHDFGVAAMVMVFAGFVVVFSDLALGAALVQRTTLSEEDVSTAFWFSTLTGAMLTGIGVAVAGLVAGFYRTPEVKPLFIALSASFLIASLGATQMALLTRAMDFRALELRMMVGMIGGGVVGVVLAASGYGPWAVILQQVSNTALSTILLWRMSSWRPRLLFSLASLRDLGSFSANVFGQRVLYFAHRNADNLLIGRYAGSTALGAYSLSYTVILAPLSRLAVPIQQVMYPALSRMQDDRRWLAESWVRVSRAIAAVSMPALVGLVVVAPDFVHVVLGPKWAIATPIIQILAWVGLVQAIQALNTDLLQAADRTSTLFRYTLVFFAAHLTAFAVGVHWGAVGVAVGYAISTAVVEPLSTVITARAIGARVWLFVRGLLPVALASAVMGGVTLLARHLLLTAGVGAAWRLLAVTLIGAIVYLPLLALAAPDVLDDAKAFRRRKTSLGGPESEESPLAPSDA